MTARKVLFTGAVLFHIAAARLRILDQVARETTRAQRADELERTAPGEREKSRIRCESTRDRADAAIVFSGLATPFVVASAVLCAERPAKGARGQRECAYHLSRYPRIPETAITYLPGGRGDCSSAA